ncbi:calmodulin regulator protein PCP4 [Pelmatolapia mariae]|uniref:calmodulin regulator protein PCP4 n=1 Tax=Pelmatolapia mariae TaxID=158779 RepID=UPI002FE5A481
MSERQTSGAAAGNNKTSGGQDASKTDVPEDFDIDLDDPETEKAAVTIQSQFRKFQKKKKCDDKS